ncbi:MAG: dihydroorotate dehydrogenase electron transfer subunit [Candidatus Cryptobacteroides sp.]
MKKEILTVISNRPVDALSKVYQMELSGCSEEQRPGQFVNIELDGLFLRRPISVCDWKDGVLTLLYKLVGKGTALMATLQPGARLDVLCSLGNGFDIDIPALARPDVPTIAGPDVPTIARPDIPAFTRPLLVGGGIGTAPLYLLARRLKERGVLPTVILGFNTASEIIYEKEFKALGLRTLVTTVDGSYGTLGFVTDALPLLASDSAPSTVGDSVSDPSSVASPSSVAAPSSVASLSSVGACGYDYCFACGPMPMLRALAPKLASPAQFSLEERMGCGTGICMGCTCPQLTGTKRICKDGPVFRLDEISF